MNKQELDLILNDAVNDSDLSCTDIPAIDLYLDQIVNLITDKNKEGSERFSDRVLTKTMINNYSKAGLIAPVKGKKYNREQIIQMLLTNSLKNTLSISEIKSAMDCFYACKGVGSDTLADCYDKYLGIKQINREKCPETVEKIIEENSFDPESGLDCFLLILTVASLSDYYRSIARAMLSEIAPRPEEKTDEKEQKEAKEKNKDKEKDKPKDKEGKKKKSDKKNAPSDDTSEAAAEVDGQGEEN